MERGHSWQREQLVQSFRSRKTEQRGDWLELRAQEKKLNMSGAWWYTLIRTLSGHKDNGGPLDGFKQRKTWPDLSFLRSSWRPGRRQLAPGSWAENGEHLGGKTDGSCY